MTERTDSIPAIALHAIPTIIATRFKAVVINDNPIAPVIVLRHDSHPPLHAGVGYIIMERSQDDSPPRYIEAVNGSYRPYVIAINDTEIMAFNTNPNLFGLEAVFIPIF